MQYAADGTLDSVTDGKGAVTDYSYDALKRLTQVVQDQNGSNPTTANATTGYDYDIADRLTTVIDPVNGTTTYSYDDLGNLLTQVSPDTGTTTFTYDSAGNQKTKTDAKGQLFNYSYDALNRLISLDAPNTADDTVFIYDTCLNGLGRLCEIQRTNANVDYEYNIYGEITAHQGVQYGYDSTGRIRTVTYPSGSVVAYQYGVDDNVSQVTLTRDGVTENLASNVTHAPFGEMTGLIYGNGHSLNHGYDTAYQLISQSVPGIYQVTYDMYDANGNLEQRSDELGYATDYFGYDALNRLNNFTHDLGSQSYIYDKNGNRTQFINSGVTSNYAYTPSSNRQTQTAGQSVMLDANGNTTFHGNRYYTYTPTNRLQSAYINWQLKGTYRYNGLGQRARKTVNNQLTTFSYGLNGELMVEATQGGTQLREYIYLDGRLLAVLDSTTGAQLTTQITQTTTPATIGSSIGVAWSGIVNPGVYDWVGVYAVGSNDFAYLDWAYTNGGADGSLNISLAHENLVAGQNYELRLYANDGFTRLATSAPFTLNPSGPTVIASSTPAILGGTLNVAWSGITSPTATDWIGVYSPANDDYAYLDWVYTSGAGSGSAVINLNHANLIAGATYEVRLYAQDGFTRLAMGNTLVLLANSQSAGTSDLYYVHTDHLGTPKAMTDEAGDKVWSATQDPFGKMTVEDSSTVAMNVRYPGQYFDNETGLHYNYFRTYDPSTGRYLESDPIGLRGGNNTFAYALSEPIYNSDEYGLSPSANKLKDGYNALDAMDKAKGAADAASALKEMNSKDQASNPNCPGSLKEYRRAGVKAVKEMINIAAPLPAGVDLVDADKTDSPLDRLYDDLSDREDNICKALPNACKPK